MSQDFPAIQRGGSLILAWQIKNKKVIVVGGGEVAAGRIYNLLCADAAITVICPSSGLNPEVAHRISSGDVAHIDRKWEPSDLDHPDIAMVMTAIDDPAAGTEIYKLCHERRIAANIADVPPECDFYFGSVHRDGPLQIMVSTGGNGPRLAATVRKSIASSLPKNIGTAIQKVGMLRRKLRKVAPNIEEGPKRMSWMIKVSDAWSLEDLCAMDEKDMDALLRYYAADEVPSFDEVSVGEELESFGFDGSFGWACVV